MLVPWRARDCFSGHLSIIESGFSVIAWWYDESCQSFKCISLEGILQSKPRDRKVSEEIKKRIDLYD